MSDVIQVPRHADGSIAWSQSAGLRAEIFHALTSEDEIAHGEAVVERDGELIRLGECAYCDHEWPCRTQRGINRLLARFDLP